MAKLNLKTESRDVDLHVSGTPLPTNQRPLAIHPDFTGWAKKTAHGVHCNNFVYSKPIFIIFGIYKA